MKTKLPFLLLTLSLLCLSYVSQAQTTQEEYNYITKGLKLQQEAGLDLKKSYKLQYLGQYSDSYGLKKIRFEFYNLLKSSLTTYQKKGIVIKINLGGQVQYHLLPASGTPALLVQQCELDLDIHKDTNYTLGSDFPDYLLCFARSLTYLTSLLQNQ